MRNLGEPMAISTALLFSLGRPFRRTYGRPPAKVSKTNIEKSGRWISFIFESLSIHSATGNIG